MQVNQFCEAHLEPQAGELFMSTGRMTVSEASAFSQAISMKRIADVIEPLAVSGVLSTEALTSLFQRLAWEAGRSFQHGMRTDR